MSRRKKKEPTVSLNRLISLCVKHPKFAEAVKQFGGASYGGVRNGLAVADALFKIDYNRVRVRSFCRDVLQRVTGVMLAKDFPADYEAAKPILLKMEDDMASSAGAFSAALFCAGMLVGLRLAAEDDPEAQA